MKSNPFKLVTELRLCSRILAEFSSSYNLILIPGHNAVTVKEATKKLNVFQRACEAI